MTDNLAEDESGDVRPPAKVRLTPEQLIALYRPLAFANQGWLPKFDLGATQSLAWSKLAADTARASQLAAKGLAPFAATRQAWTRQASVINSDYFKTHTASQAAFANLSASLSKSVDFGIDQPFKRIAEQFARDRANWLKSLPTIAHLSAAFYPPNLADIDGLLLEEVEKVVMADGIALYGVPRASIAEAILRADSAAKRREILGRRWSAISQDCRTAIAECDSEAVAHYAPYALAALAALDGGHTAASQALLASLLDSLVKPIFGESRHQFTPSRKNRTAAAYDEFTVRQFIAFAPIWQAWQQFHPGQDPIPSTFSRHATAHTVSGRQFNRRNAVQGVLLASTLIYFLNEQALAKAA